MEEGVEPGQEFLQSQGVAVEGGSFRPVHTVQIVVVTAGVVQGVREAVPQWQELYTVVVAGELQAPGHRVYTGAGVVQDRIRRHIREIPCLVAQVVNLVPQHPLFVTGVYQVGVVQEQVLTAV